MKTIESKQGIKGMLFVFVLLACFQNVQLLSISEYAALKPVHLFSLLFLPLLFCKKTILINKYLILYVGYITAISIANIKMFGLNSLLLNYIFGLYIVVVCVNCGNELSGNDWLDVVCTAASFLMIAVVIKNFFGYRDFVWYFENPDKEHPWGLKTIISGGLNIESSWLGIFAFFFYKSRWKWIYATINLLISILYGSRSGMLIAGFAILWLIIPELPKLKVRKYRLIVAITLIVIGIVIFRSGFYDAVIGRALSRFFENFVDTGSMARVRMWSHVLQTSTQYPMGCGVGNCMKALMAVSGETYVDGNLHNVYLQNLIDQGWIGGIFYLGLVLRFFWRKKEEYLSNPFVAALFSYCVASLVQFRGADTLGLLLLGMELAISKDKMGKEYYVIKRE